MSHILLESPDITPMYSDIPLFDSFPFTINNTNKQECLYTLISVTGSGHVNHMVSPFFDVYKNCGLFTFCMGTTNIDSVLAGKFIC